MKDLKEKSVIITGASKGIGKAMAHHLGKLGARIVLSSRKQEAVDSVAEEFRAEGIECHALACNVGNFEELPALVEGTIAAYGGIDVLINNAGTNPHFGPVADAPDWAWDKIMDVNLRGPFELSRLVFPHMKKNGGGSIINISSVEGFTPSPGLGIYSISKAALIMETKVLAREWGAFSIRVNAICPGFIRTKLSEGVFQNKAMLQMVMAKQALGKSGAPEDIAGLAALLASDQSAFITGSIFTADGGLTV